MNTRVRLVFIPGHPLSLESLCPKPALMESVEALRDEGISTEILDWGCLDMLEGMRPEDASVGRDGHKRTGPFWGKGHPAMKAPEYCDAPLVAARITARPPVLAVFYADSRADYCALKPVVRAVRAAAPTVHQTLAGPFASDYGFHVLYDDHALDSVVPWPPAATLPLLLRGLDHPETLSRIPGLIYRDKGGLVRVPGRPRTDHATHPERFHLPAFMEGEDCPGFFSLFHTSFSRRRDFAPESMKSPEQLADEIETLQHQHGARAFHIDAAQVSADDLERFAALVLERDLIILYSLGMLDHAFSAAVADTLFASGCRAAGFRIPSGSQGLMEDFYGEVMSVSAMAATLRQSKSAGLFTTLHLCFPCPRDTHHTRAETQHLVAASRPDSVCLRLPTILPHSAWHLRPADYGFVLKPRRFQQWVRCDSRAPEAQPYAMRGWKPGSVDREQLALTEDIRDLGCRIDVTERECLLARLACGSMDEDAFLESLKRALTTRDVKTLGRLMARVNAPARQLEQIANLPLEPALP